MPTATLYFEELPLVPFPLAWGTHSQWLVDTGYKGLPLYLKVGPPVWCDFHSRAYMGSGWSWALPETMSLHTNPPRQPHPHPTYTPFPTSLIPLLSGTIPPYITLSKNQHPNPSSGSSSREPKSDPWEKWNRKSVMAGKQFRRLLQQFS